LPRGQRGAKCGDGGGGVAKQRMVGRAVLVQLGRIDVAADHGPAANLPFPQVGIAEFGADHE
jgi:hypothetical protein